MVIFLIFKGHCARFTVMNHKGYGVWIANGEIICRSLVLECIFKGVLLKHLRSWIDQENSSRLVLYFNDALYLHRLPQQYACVLARLMVPFFWLPSENSRTLYVHNNANLRKATPS